MTVKLFIRASEDGHYVMPDSKSILFSPRSLVVFLLKAEPLDKLPRDYFGLVSSESPSEVPANVYPLFLVNLP